MSLDSLFSEVHNLPSIPEIVQELIEKFNDSGIDSDEVSSKLKMDQNLSLKVMRLANSARFGGGRKINSIESAVVMLGFDTLKTLVIASGMTGAFKDIPGIDKTKFWRDSFSVASICKLLAKNCQSEPEVAFTCGMLHNVGLTLMYLAHTEKMDRIAVLVDEGASRAELEKNQFGYDFSEVGSKLLESWRFPEEVIRGVSDQLDPLASEEFSAYAAIVYVSTYLHRCSLKEKSKEDILADFPSDVASPLELDLLSLFEELTVLLEEEDDLGELLA